MNLLLKEKIFIVTGGAKGIGEAISRVLAGECLLAFTYFSWGRVY